MRVINFREDFCNHGSAFEGESNGLLFGVTPDCCYPVCELTLAPGDRLLVCTDGQYIFLASQELARVIQTTQQMLTHPRRRTRIGRFFADLFSFVLESEHVLR